MNKITSYSEDYQTFHTLSELETVAGKKVTVDFSTPELSSFGGMPLVREYEKSPYLVLVYEEKSWHSLLNDLHASKRS